jgi:transposase-like protein
MAAVAMSHGINANLLRRWVHETARPPTDVTSRQRQSRWLHRAADAGSFRIAGGE